MPGTHHPEVALVRHGETEWTITRRHTGNTDVPLTDVGRQEALALGKRLSGETFDLVLTSPLSRAAETCRLAGLGADAQVRDELREWNYGAYEGLTSAAIRERHPGWLLWTDGVVDGESISDVADRVDRVIADIRAATDGRVAVFAHGHLLRVFAARWLGQPPELGAHLTLGPASICRLAWEHGVPAILLWNDRSHLGE